MRAFPALVAAAILTIAALPANAEPSVSFMNSMPIGSAGLCEAQIQAPAAEDGLFERRYVIVCQDAAAPVGTLNVLDDPASGALASALAGAGSSCVAAPRSDLQVPGLSAEQRYACASADGLQRLVLLGSAHGNTYAAAGVAAYEDALLLGLGNLATDRLLEGEIAIPLTEASDAQAFARAQAEAISADAALAEAYHRANAGNFAEAAEFFAASAAGSSGKSVTEAQLNAALQQSNLGNFYEAAMLFVSAREMVGEDPVLTRLLRNFEAIDALNRDAPAEALLTLDTPLPGNAISLDAAQRLEITEELANRMAAEQGNAISGASGDITVLERAQLLDAQSQYIRATALRQQGLDTEAREILTRAQSDLISVRDGRIVTILWLRAQILAELAELDERQGNLGAAESRFAEGIDLLENFYPGSPALVSARAQLAGFYARNGREDDALALFRALVSNAESKPASALRRLLAPYFALLAERSDRPETAADMFAASQLLLRPGLAQTQAVLARELSGGSDEAAQLFRQSLNVGRAIERLRAQIAQQAMDAGIGEAAPGSDIAARQTQLGELELRQLQLQEQLAQYPRYRVASTGVMDLAALQAALQPGEAYYKLVMLNRRSYAIFAEQGTARSFEVEARSADIGSMVDSLRDSIAIEQAGQTITYPFEIATARDLYKALFGPVDGSLRNVRHLVFEPDGEMLRLPVNLLVADDASVRQYESRLATSSAADPYDFTGTSWLGRAMQVTTAVSPVSFRDVRNTRASDARVQYLGLGQNSPVSANYALNTGTRSGLGMSDRCLWAPGTWNNPIRADELVTAENIIENGGGSGQLLTGDAFTDTGLEKMDGLNEFRILHFATHGLVTAPNPDCPPRPALLTSFGDGDSDGLLSFAEIFDLKLDADLVVLSACNTAAPGGLSAARDAGIGGGGDFALDGLVRAFVGAGGRTVVASHWPVPDDYQATNRLISGLFGAGNGVATTEALRQAQLGLMDDPLTSHPFYWSAFAVIGDGTVPVRR